MDKMQLDHHLLARSWHSALGSWLSTKHERACSVHLPDACGALVAGLQRVKFIWLLLAMPFRRCDVPRSRASQGTHKDLYKDKIIWLMVCGLQLASRLTSSEREIEREREASRFREKHSYVMTWTNLCNMCKYPSLSLGRINSINRLTDAKQNKYYVPYVCIGL